MIKRINNRVGQTALIMILLAAAALIFYAISLNWGRIAQTKTLVTIAASQGASLLASEAASYGEMQKVTYLKDQNQYVGLSQVIIDIILVVVAVVLLVITIISWGSASPLWCAFVVLAVAMAILNLTLQLVVVQPGINKMWSKLQQNQPMQQQFYEQGIEAALQSGITDQVNITDYFDLSPNGVFGYNSAQMPNDSISRFALYYTDRLKMLNQPIIPQVEFFYNQLGELLNGETCDQNVSDYSVAPNAVVLNPICKNLNCVLGPTEPACQMKIQGGFQLTDACADSNPNSSTYNPYCDPCCVPVSNSTQQQNPYFNPNSLSNNQYLPIRPSSPTCPQDAVPAQCLVNNPYVKSGPFNCVTNPTDPCCTTAGASNPDCVSPYPFLYDPSYQNYADGVSFLAKLGRDEQMPPFYPMAPTGVFPKDFPNGTFPYFWLMSQWSAQVDNIKYDNLTPNPKNPNAPSEQLHWCSPNVTGSSTTSTPAILSSGVPPIGYSDLAQLSLTFCQNQNCCVNSLADYIATSTDTDTATATGTDTGTTTGDNTGTDTSTGTGTGACPATSTFTACNYQFVVCQTCGGSTPDCGSSCGITPSTCGVFKIISGQQCPNGVLPNGKGAPDYLPGGATPQNMCAPGNRINCPGGDGTTSSTTSCCGTCDSPGIPGVTCYQETDQCNCGTTGTDTDTDTSTGTEPSIPVGVSSYTIDKVGDADITPNPALSSEFGYGSPVSTDAWIPGDDQFCYVPSSSGVPTWPYNATTAVYQDGMCEWTGQTISNTTYAGAIPGADPTMDSLDDTMHTLSDFVNFSNAFLQISVGQLSSTFYAWYPQVAEWIAPGCPSQELTCSGTGVCTTPTYGACSSSNPFACGVTCNPGGDGRLIALPARLQAWDEAFLTWLDADNSNTNAWCLPPSTNSGFYANGNKADPTDEYNYINTNGNSNDAIDPNITPKWGDVGHVIACLNYSASVTNPVNNTTAMSPAATAFNNCLNALPINACPSVLPTACLPVHLGRTLVDPKKEPEPENPLVPTTAVPNPCDPNVVGSYAHWVKDSLVMLTSQAPKFALRAAFLTDVYTRAQNIELAIAGPNGNNGAQNALTNFLKPCSGTDCDGGGPASQLMWARQNAVLGTPLPNSVIYGWQDNLLNGTQGGCRDSNGDIVGCAHIVKVTAYGPGRQGLNNGVAFAPSSLPIIQTSEGVFTRSYTLVNRDGYVYASVRRWDQNHSNPLTFPNQHSLWQFMFHNPKSNPNPGALSVGLPQACIGLTVPGGGPAVGFGLLPSTVLALQNSKILPQDLTSLQQAFMLNDEGSGANAGKVDPSANTSSYKSCLTQADKLLACGTESHACAAYFASSIQVPGYTIASRQWKEGGYSPAGSGGDGDGGYQSDYKLYFADCSSTPGLSVPADDLMPSGTSNTCQE